jgi:hypothetical protein
VFNFVSKKKPVKMIDTSVPVTFTSWLKNMKGGGMKGGDNKSVTFGEVALTNVLATTVVTNHINDFGFNITVAGDNDKYEYEVKMCLYDNGQVGLTDDERMYLNIFLIISVLSWHILALNDPHGRLDDTRENRESVINKKIGKVVEDFCKLYMGKDGNVPRKSRRRIRL